MTTVTFKGDVVRVEVPKELYKALVKLQAGEDLDLRGACLKAAELLDVNSVEFRKAVEREADRLYRSRLMKEVNKARSSIRGRAWEEGAEWVRMNEDNFRVPCSVCGKPMCFSSRDYNWEREKEVLYRAFANWHHASCKR